MTKLWHHVVVVTLCLVATVAAKIYVDRVLVGPSQGSTPTDSAEVTVEAPVGMTVATP